MPELDTRPDYLLQASEVDHYESCADKLERLVAAIKTIIEIVEDE